MQPPSQPAILTNMAFWQSPVWTRQTVSLYPLDRGSDPRPYSPLGEAGRLWQRSRSFDAVVTMGARASLAYGLLCALTGRPSKQIMTEVFIDRPRAAHPLWRLKVWAYRWIARRAIGILTNSSAELETIARRFATPADRLRYVPLHTNIPAPVRSECDDGFVLSAGRTLRDYSTLVRAAERLQSPLVIICGANDLADVRLPGHVTLRREVDRATYLDILGRCSVVALPLLETERSTGQVVLLEAMALGKPVVTTRSPGTIDHVESGRNGILVEVGDHEGLAREVNVLMQDPARRRQLGEAAAADLLDHTFDRHAERKLLAINELWKLHRASHHAESS